MNYPELFGRIRNWCHQATASDIDTVMSLLTEQADLPTTKAIDRYLGEVNTTDGVSRIEHYLFHGTQMQRNYCTLFFARRNDWPVVNRAYEMGLVDRLQAYSR